MYIYLISEGESGPVKIGKSQSPMHRLFGLQTSNPSALRLVEMWKVDPILAGLLESQIHGQLSGLRMEGEWFLMSESEASDSLSSFFASRKAEKMPIPPVESKKAKFVHPNIKKFFRKSDKMNYR